MTNTKQWIGYRITKGNRYYIGVVQALKWDRPVKAYTHPRHGYQPATPYYMGSGFDLLRAIIKHGVEAFDREILARFDNLQDAEAWEVANVVMQEQDPLSYNLRSGGKSGFKVGKASRAKMKASSVNKTPPVFHGRDHPNYGKRGKDSPKYIHGVAREPSGRISRAKGAV